ncbi:unnamed protein product [Rhodiola kirilowii]
MQWEAKFEVTGHRLGMVGNVCLALLFYPVARATSILGVFGLTSESSIKYHIWLGHITMALFTSHGLFYFIYWAATHELHEIVTWEPTGVANLPGVLALVAGLIMWAFTFPKIRRKMVRAFLLLTLPLHPLHVLFHPPCWDWICLHDAPRLLPLYRRSLHKILTVPPTDSCRIFSSSSIISKLQWHPFTISSSSSLEPEKLSVVIKTEGSWSRKLHQILSSSASVDRLEVSVEGPYGPASTNFLRHDMLVMVSGGSGLTPFISITRELISTSMKGCRTPISPPSLCLQEVIPARNAGPSAAVGELCRAIQHRYSNRGLCDEREGTHHAKVKADNHTMVANPITTFTRSTHNTNKIYSSASRALLNMLFLCACIVIYS